MEKRFSNSKISEDQDLFLLSTLPYIWKTNSGFGRMIFTLGFER